jgi:hypothetical protein
MDVADPRRPRQPLLGPALSLICGNPSTAYCGIALILHMTPAEGQTDGEITTRYTRNLHGNLLAMKKTLGLALESLGHAA